MRNQGTATKRNTAGSATNFVKVVRALLWNPPRSAAASTVTVPAPAPEVEEDDFNEASTDRIRKNRGPRTALDVSGHRFAKNLQVEIGRSRNRRQQLIASDRDSDAESLFDTVSQRQQHQLHHQQHSIFFDEDRGLFSSSRTAWPRECDGRGGHEDGVKSSPRSSRASSTTSTLPPSPDANGTTAANRPRSELPPRVPKTTRSRCAAGTCRRQKQQQQQSSRASFFA